MPEPRFIHLRLHSEYSITDGIVRLEDAVRAAARDGQGALALTDLGNVFGWVKFYQYALRQGVKPIAGCDVWITNPGERDQPSRLLLLVRNARGYLNLCELLSRAWLTNVYQGRAEIAFEWLESGLAEGLIAYSARSRAISDSPLPRAIWRRRGNARSAGRACSRTVSISRCSAPTSPKKRSISSTPSIWPCSFRFRSSPRSRCSL